MALRKMLLAAALVLWALFVFLASNGPDDVEARARDWLASPILSNVPLALMEFASSRSVIALTFLALGSYLGWKASRWRKQPLGHWWHTLSAEMSSIIHSIDASPWTDNLERLNADIMVMSLKARKRGLDFPTPEAGFKDVQHFLPYLHRVGALLREGEVQAAREAAKELAARRLSN